MSYKSVKSKLDRGELVILDGAIGSEMLRRHLTWEGHKVDSHPNIIRSIHADYVAAGADLISTNTFQLARRSWLAHFRDLEHMRHIGAPGLENRAGQMIHDAVELARQARDASPRKNDVAVAGAMTTLEWCFRPDLTPAVDAMRAEYRETIQAFVDAGVDLMLFETFNRWLEAQVALEAAREVGIPAWVAFVPDWSGHLLSGESIATMGEKLAPLAPDVILFNCAPPPDITRALGELARCYQGRSGAYAHVGRFDPPDWMFTDEYPPEKYLAEARSWIKNGATVLGGCCGTTPMHIEALAHELPRMAAGRA
jgi:methionine synthase I (cobalamin-dependent)